MNIYTAKFYKINFTFSESKLKKQSCLCGTAPKKMFTWRKIIPAKWHLNGVEVRSHLGRMNPVSYKRFGFTK